MQTDVWLNEAGNQNRCPMCSAPLNAESETCFACGFSSRPAPSSPISSVWIDPVARRSSNVLPAPTMATRQRRRQPNPTTPIPQRPNAHALYERQPQARQERRTEDLREHAPVIWQYESPNYEVASSLPSLSLIAPEVPTQPQPPVVAPRPTHRPQTIDEIDTQPPLVLRAPRAAPPLPATPPTTAQESTPRALIAMPPYPLREPQDAASWTAGTASNSIYAQVIAGDGRGDWRKQLAFNPLDRLRWWLLRPGRIEFLLGLSGTLLLILVTCALLFALAFSFQNMAGVASLTAKSVPTSSKTGGHARGKATPLPFVTPTTKAIPGTTTAGTTGTTGTTPTTLPRSTPTPTTTTTATSTPIPQGSPVNKTPAPTTPTPSPVPATPTPSPVPTQSPTATTSPTPTTTATPKPTATATKTVSPTVTPAGSPRASNTNLSNALNQSGEPPIDTPLSSASPLLWLMAACYSLSMILLGVAGILYKRRPQPL